MKDQALLPNEGQIAEMFADRFEIITGRAPGATETGVCVSLVEDLIRQSMRVAFDIARRQPGGALQPAGRKL